MSLYLYVVKNTEKLIVHQRSIGIESERTRKFWMEVIDSKMGGRGDVAEATVPDHLILPCTSRPAGKMLRMRSVLRYQLSIAHLTMI